MTGRFTTSGRIRLTRNHHLCGGALQTKNTGNLLVHSQNVRVYREVSGSFKSVRVSYRFFIHCISHSYIYHAKLWSKKIFGVFVWFMTEILGITSYKQEDHLLGLVWVTILGLVFELFWWWVIDPICIFKSVGFILYVQPIFEHPQYRN